MLLVVVPTFKNQPKEQWINFETQLFHMCGYSVCDIGPEHFGPFYLTQSLVFKENHLYFKVRAKTCMVDPWRVSPKLLWPRVGTSERLSSVNWLYGACQIYVGHLYRSGEFSQ